MKGLHETLFAAAFAITLAPHGGTPGNQEGLAAQRWRHLVNFRILIRSLRFFLVKTQCIIRWLFSCISFIIACNDKMRFITSRSSAVLKNSSPLDGEIRPEVVTMTPSLG